MGDFKTLLGPSCRHLQTNLAAEEETIRLAIEWFCLAVTGLVRARSESGIVFGVRREFSERAIVMPPLISQS